MKRSTFALMLAALLMLALPAHADTQQTFPTLSAAGPTPVFQPTGAFASWGLDYHVTGAATCQIEHYDATAAQWEPFEIPDGLGGWVQLGYLVSTGTMNVYVPGIAVAYGVQLRLNCLSITSGVTVSGSWEN